MTAPIRRRDLRTLRRLGVLAAVMALLACTTVTIPGLTPRAEAAIPPLAQRTDDVVTADALPTVQIDNGYVWAQTMIGNTVYAVGGFENTRAPLAPPGTQLTPRANALAYDITTGRLDADWAPEVNGPVRAVVASPDGSRIYIGGSFNRVNGQSRWNVAVLDADTGELVDGVRPAVGGTGVYALAVTEDTLYTGGLFTQANGAVRTNTAAFATANGALRPWAPRPDHQVDALVVDPAGTNIILGGRFMAVNGDDQLQGLAAVNLATGAVDDAWALSDIIKNGNYQGNRTHSGISSLSTDGKSIYGTGWNWRRPLPNLEGTFAAVPGTGKLRWLADCHGDHYAVFSTGKTVYAAGHTHGCSTLGLHADQSPAAVRHVEAYSTNPRGRLGPNPDRSYKSWEGTPAPSAFSWEPSFYNGTTSGIDQAVLSITGTDEFLSVAGEFPGVNGGRYEGIVRFATDPPGGPRRGPELSGAGWKAEALPTAPGRARVGIGGNWDRDDFSLTYELRREGADAPVDSVTAESTWWKPPRLELEDPAAPAGRSTYTVVARDGDGNEATSAPVVVDVADGSVSSYSDAVLADNPLLAYPLGDTTQPLVGSTSLLRGARVSAVADGIARSDSGSSSLDSGFRSYLTPRGPATASPGTFTAEVWMRSDSRLGGRLLGFSNRQSWTSTRQDRVLYMTDAGRLVFGTQPGRTRVVTSTKSYNDGRWHHVVASQGANGMTLTVDGEVVASDPNATAAAVGRGYWRLGADRLGTSWPDRPTNVSLDGELDEVAIYGDVLTPAQIRTHYEIGRG